MVTTWNGYEVEMPRVVPDKVERRLQRDKTAAVMMSKPATDEASTAAPASASPIPRSINHATFICPQSHLLVTTIDVSGNMYAQQQGQQQLAYAPMPYSYTPSHNLTATVNLDDEVKLAESVAERELYESLAEVYSIIITLDALEKAYLRDSIRESEYTETCDRLLRQYKSVLADKTVATAFGDLDSFKAQWSLEVPKATERLRIGLPATVQQAPAQQQRPASQQPGTNSAATHIVAASESFITLFDAVKLNILSKETLHPILVDTIQAVNKVTDRDFENKGKIIQWLITLNQMRVADSLTPEQARELQFDMQLAYDGFKSVLES